MKKKLNWEKLEDFRCPECGERLSTVDSKVLKYSCSNKKCKFIITGYNFDKVICGVIDKPKKYDITIEEELKNQTLINNL